DLVETVCQERNARRQGRMVDPDIVRRQVATIRRTLADPAALLAEGFAALYVLDSPELVDAAVVVRDAALPRAELRPDARRAAAGRDGEARKRPVSRPNAPRGR